MFQFSRTINIIAENLGGSTAPTLILTFDDQPMKGIYKDYFPVVWKRSTFPTEGDYALMATYKSQLVFVNPQVDDNTLTSPETWVDINLGQQTKLIENTGFATNSFTTPTGGVGDTYIKAINQTPTPQTIGVGFADGSILPHILLVFDDIGSMYNVTAQFSPILTAYITEDYQEHSVLRGAVQTPAIWKQNLANLKETTNWKLTRNPLSGDYSITAA